MAEPADPRLIRLVRELDEERRKRIAAERRNNVLVATLARLKAQRTADARPKPEQRPG